jgi:hypothetical protein
MMTTPRMCRLRTKAQQRLSGTPMIWTSKVFHQIKSANWRRAFHPWAQPCMPLGDAAAATFLPRDVARMGPTAHSATSPMCNAIRADRMLANIPSH